VTSSSQAARRLFPHPGTAQLADALNPGDNFLSGLKARLRRAARAHPAWDASRDEVPRRQRDDGDHAGHARKRVGGHGVPSRVERHHAGGLAQQEAGSVAEAAGQQRVQAVRHGTRSGAVEPAEPIGHRPGQVERAVAQLSASSSNRRKA
jgi:hypothetical protein